jgi:tubulin epsilon
VLRESIRQATEKCDSLQSFLLLHSLGGGTGSGLGTYLLQMLADEYHEVFRFCTSVFPSADDDVVTSPYNSVLSTAQLIEHADCVLPLDNEALGAIASRIAPSDPRERGAQDAAAVEQRARSRAFDAMNSVAAQLLLNLTASMRFGGALNVDLNEITMNLVPFPKLHFLMSSLAPVQALWTKSSSSVGSAARSARPAPMRSLDQMFSDIFSPDNQLMKADPRRSVFLSVALMARGHGIEISDVRRNIDRLSASQSIQFAHWNTDAWKVGLCATPPLSASAGHPRSLLCLANSCAIADRFKSFGSRFDKLYRRKAHVFHYTEYMEEDGMTNAREALETTIRAYSELAQNKPKDMVQRFAPLG